MKISFRQGIVRFQTGLQGPTWIQKTSLSGTTVDLNASSAPVVITFAHYSANYVFEETKTVVGAWGGGTPGSINGPLVPQGQTQYLFWDVDLATGFLSHGWTLSAPVVTSIEPTNPVDGMHWFDSVNTRMRVYRNNGSSPGLWQDKIRVFAAVYDQNANIIPYPLGTQVGINTGVWDAGNLILGTNNKPLKQADGTFVTTASDLIIQQTGGQNVQFDMALKFAMAAEDIPKFYLVSFQPNDTMVLARSSNLYLFVSGICVEDLYEEEVGQVISSGMVRNDQWNFTDAQINAPVFCGPTGQVTLTPPAAGVVQQVGFVADTDAIYMNLFPPVRIR